MKQNAKFTKSRAGVKFHSKTKMILNTMQSEISNTLNHHSKFLPYLVQSV